MKKTLSLLLLISGFILTVTPATANEECYQFCYKKSQNKQCQNCCSKACSAHAKNKRAACMAACVDGYSFM